ncbi:MAG: orotate phosphoribosyltransferase [Chloroflexi bacterium]|nr:orotate phosphoribosyltransferase [Chloroflexota bacterium]
MIQPSRQRLLELAKALGALRFGEFTLSSGQKSSYYFDGRLLSLSAEGAHLLGREVVRLARRSQVQAVGGPTIGADPIVAAAVALSHVEGYPLRGFLVRSDTKEHGTRKLVEGPLEPASRVMVLDDACTTGGNLFHAIGAAEAQGCRVALVMAVLDRHQGGSEQLRQRGYSFVALLEADAQGNIQVAPEETTAA